MGCASLWPSYTASTRWMPIVLLVLTSIRQCQSWIRRAPIRALSSTMIEKAGSASNGTHHMRATIIHDVKEGGKALRMGGLVAFPTETVYGLGANAYDESAVQRIFKVKGRPLTDPLIAHVSQAAEAWAVFKCNGQGAEGELLKTLAARFWPGPLTIVAPAADALPGAVTAGTGWVGVRCPKHPLARQLIADAGVPVVAPSANRFGHVSPTSSEHVLSDLGAHDIMILHERSLDNEQNTQAPNGAWMGEECSGKLERACEIGIESTVAKVDMTEQKITILRAGAVTPTDLKQCLASTPFRHVAITSLSRTPAAAVADDDTTPQIAPGQLIRHYAPDVPTFLVRSKDTGLPWAEDLAQTAIVLDIGGRLAAFKSRCRAYRDLAAGGDVRDAAAQLFDGLRWAETQASEAGASTVLLPELRAEHDEVGGDSHEAQGASADHEFLLAVADRLTRAASGEVATPATVDLVLGTKQR